MLKREIVDLSKDSAVSILRDLNSVTGVFISEKTDSQSDHLSLLLEMLFILLTYFHAFIHHKFAATRIFCIK
jgi:TorA maturation chaperone TorD